MELTGSDGNSDGRSYVIQLETEEEQTTKDEQATKSDIVLQSFSPLIINMRLFGLYFTRETATGTGMHVGPNSTSQRVLQGIRGCSDWNAGRIYATIMLVVMWLNALRVCIVFHGKETFEAALLTKIALLPAALLFAVLQTAYYVASHTGSLDRVFCQADLSVAGNSATYSRRGKVATVVCWLLITPAVIIDVFVVFASEQPGDPLLSLLTKTFHMSRFWVNVIGTVCVLLYLLAMASVAFPQALNCKFIGSAQ